MNVDRANILRRLLNESFCPNLVQSSQIHISGMDIYNCIYFDSHYYNSIKTLMPFQESKKYLRNFVRYPPQSISEIDKVPEGLLQFVLTSTPKGDPLAILEAINGFCRNHVIMNIGEDKGVILIDTITKTQPKTILEIGCFIGFSSLLMAAHSNALVHTIEPDLEVATIAKQIHQHAGLSHRIVIHNGTIQSEGKFLQNHGKFDVIFIDHWKDLYLQDFLEMEKLGAIGVGTTVIGDNIIYPGSPDYLEHLRGHRKYDSVLYHSYLEYTQMPDAVLVSQRTVE